MLNRIEFDNFDVALKLYRHDLPNLASTISFPNLKNKNKKKKQILSFIFIYVVFVDDCIEQNNNES
jgi:hypothetical protein